ncbi:MAG: RHS repeat-associated core domain-containing protein, partial [Chloroflexi bacterium]|nr:RHS repeat-associated core domain-containing protein [Chloroflexota bacterium]
VTLHALHDGTETTYLVETRGSTAWNIPAVTLGEGNNVLWATSTDLFGNVSASSVSVIVTRDNTAPVGSVQINGGDEFADQYDVTLTLDATDAYIVSDVLLSNDCCPSQGWQPYAPGDVAWTLAGGDGARQVWARYRDAAGNESAWYSDTITVDTLPPVASIYAIVEDSPYAHVDGGIVYFGAQAGGFEVRVAAQDSGSGLAQAEFPAATSAGGVYGTALAGDYQYAHTYDFTAASTEEGDYQVVVSDQVGREAQASFTVARDVTPPQVSVDATVQDDIVTVSWDASDGGSGLNTCTLEVREGDGEWQTFSTDCAGTDTYSPSPGETCTFRLDASDHTGNQASAEETTGVSRVTKYYYAGGQRVAMRAGDVLYYLHGDHLGSTSLTTDENGGVTARQLYYPYGEVRWDEGTLATDFGFTGQRSVKGTGLVFMHARFYDPYLNRFISADTIVPDPENPLSFNRYMYVLGNPILYIDPSGHAEDLGGAECVPWLPPKHQHFEIHGSYPFAQVTRLGSTVVVSTLSGDTQQTLPPDLDADKVAVFLGTASREIVNHTQVDLYWFSGAEALVLYHSLAVNAMPGSGTDALIGTVGGEFADTVTELVVKHTLKEVGDVILPVSPIIDTYNFAAQRTQADMSEVMWDIVRLQLEEKGEYGIVSPMGIAVIGPFEADNQSNFPFNHASYAFLAYSPEVGVSQVVFFNGGVHFRNLMSVLDKSTTIN